MAKDVPAEHVEKPGKRIFFFQKILPLGVAAVSGGAVFNLPNPLTNKFLSFFMLGGGALIFHPENADAAFETKNAIVIGGGINVPLNRHLAIRGQAKTSLYKAPDFGLLDPKVNKYTQAIIPSAG